MEKRLKSAVLILEWSDSKSGVPVYSQEGVPLSKRAALSLLRKYENQNHKYKSKKVCGKTLILCHHGNGVMLTNLTNLRKLRKLRKQQK